MFHVLGQICCGLAVGAIVSLLMPCRTLGGIGLTVAIGFVGSLLGSLAGRALFGLHNYSAGWVVSILGALLLLGLYRILSGPRSAY